MKRMLIVLGVASLMGLMGCSEEPVETVNNKPVYSPDGSSWYRVKFDGHIYVVMSGSQFRNGIVHDPDCPCHVKEVIIKEKLEK